MRRLRLWVLIALCLPGVGCFRLCDRIRDREDNCAPARTASRCDNPCNAAPPAPASNAPTYVPSSHYQPDDCR